MEGLKKTKKIGFIHVWVGGSGIRNRSKSIKKNKKKHVIKIHFRPF